MGQDEGTRNTLDGEEFKRATEEIRDLKLLGFYCFLRGRLGNEGGWLSYRGLSEERRISFQTVQEFLGSLRDLGLIRLRRHGCKGTYLWFVSEMDCPSGETGCPAEGDGVGESPMEPYVPDTSGLVPSGIGYAALRTERWLFRFERLPRAGEGLSCGRVVSSGPRDPDLPQCAPPLGRDLVDRRSPSGKALRDGCPRHGRAGRPRRQGTGRGWGSLRSALRARSALVTS
ncbi:hypothetical protein Apau_1975 [Aminomonas paucivorans DSM 12260]|uniref:Uncharacterized protein n=1 Tax=Aminomonas paucivorans DSM 12260 TaxID=584708 RepID=E3CX41_9BACT|nr:hypothetical protein Apau_1975 [Aminomonas paucivorans DSM 12260]